MNSIDKILPFISDNSDVLDVSIALIMLIASAVVGLIKLIKFLINKTRSKKIDKINQSYQDYRDYPFASTLSNNLEKLEELVSPGGILNKYIPRLPKEYQQVTDTILSHDRILITGRTGIGKTRECLEAIKELERREGDPVTIYYPLYDTLLGCSMTPVKAGSFNKRPLLFIDNIKSIFDADPKIGLKQLDLDTTQERLEDAIGCLQRKNEGRLKIIITVADESEFINKLKTSQRKFWDQFKKYQIPSIHPKVALSFINKVAKNYNFILAPDAALYIKKNSDLTCKGIVNAFKRLSKENQANPTKLGIQDVKGIKFTWPVNSDEVINLKIKDKPLCGAIFNALGILSQLWLDPYEFLVVDIAARLDSKKFQLFKRRRIKHLIRNDLKRWMYPSKDGRVICQDAYVSCKGLTDRSIPSLQAALKKAFSNEEQLFILLPSFSKMVPRLMKVSGNYNQTTELLEIAAKNYGNFFFVWRSLYILYILQEKYELAIKAARNLVKLKPDAVSLHQLSLAYGKNGQYVEAVDTAQRAVCADSEYAPTLHSLTINLSNLRKTDEAISAGKKLVKLRNIAPYLNTLSITYGKAGYHDDAVLEARKAIDLDPEYVPAWHSLVINLEKSGKINKAIEAGKTLIRLAAIPEVTMAW